MKAMMCIELEVEALEPILKERGLMVAERDGQTMFPTPSGEAFIVVERIHDPDPSAQGKFRIDVTPDTTKEEILAALGDWR